MENRIQEFFNTKNITTALEIGHVYGDSIRDILTDNVSIEEVETLFSVCDDNEEAITLIHHIFKDFKAKGQKGDYYYPYYEAALKSFLANEFFQGVRIATIVALSSLDAKNPSHICEYDANLILDIVATYRDEWVTYERLAYTDDCPDCNDDSEDEESYCLNCAATHCAHSSLTVVVGFIVLFQDKNILPKQSIIIDLFSFFEEEYPLELCNSVYDMRSFEDFCKYLQDEDEELQKEFMLQNAFSESDQAYMFRYHLSLFNVYAQIRPIVGALALQMLQNGELSKESIGNIWIDSGLIDEYVARFSLDTIIEGFISFLENGAYELLTECDLDKEYERLGDCASNMDQPLTKKKQRRIEGLIEKFKQQDLEVLLAMV